MNVERERERCFIHMEFPSFVRLPTSILHEDCIATPLQYPLQQQAAILRWKWPSIRVIQRAHKGEPVSWSGDNWWAVHCSARRTHSKLVGRHSYTGIEHSTGKKATSHEE